MVRFAGPMSEDEEQVWLKALRFRDSFEEDFEWFREEMKHHPDQSIWREHALLEQKYFDRINDRLPKRYKKELKGRILDAPKGHREK